MPERCQHSASAGLLCTIPAPLRMTAAAAWNWPRSFSGLKTASTSARENKMRTGLRVGLGQCLTRPVNQRTEQCRARHMAARRGYARSCREMAVTNMAATELSVKRRVSTVPSANRSSLPDTTRFRSFALCLLRFMSFFSTLRVKKRDM